MDQIKDAFSKVKRDVESLYFELSSLKNTLNEVNWRLEMLSKDVQTIRQEKLNEIKKEEKKKETFIPTHFYGVSADRQINQTRVMDFRPGKDQIKHISTGNEGVTTDRQTYRQTDQQTQNHQYNEEIMIKTKPKTSNPIQSAAEILDSLDSLKKEIRLKFKRLTKKEMLVFSTLYHLDEEKGFADYKMLAEKLNLTQSSIRDYVGRIIEKGIPVDKKKVNNKSIQLFVSSELKKVAPLSTILQLIKL